MCVDDKFAQPYKSYLGEDAVYSFIDSMVEESKYCSDGMKKHFNREFPMTKKNNEEFRNSIKCWICDHYYDNVSVKARHHRHITGKYGGSAHRDCNIKDKLNHKFMLYFTT